ncbi:MAG: 4Fe-4S dicluster domain-containing protein [Candidatus Brocadiales bacterium]|nr:4Fe-4S dicluster domain-containing protein [Candidatus Brocadiales bacterium]
MLKILKNIFKEVNAPEASASGGVDLRRRQFFREAFLQVTDALRELAQERMGPRKYLRPPGAVEELTFLSLCTCCDECIRVCPHEAIRGAGVETGLPLGSPIIIPKEKPCYLCEDFPCIKVCKEGALKLPARREEVRMGLAVIDNESCVSSEIQFCQSCVLACPLSGEAIYMEGGKPIVNKEKCTGCGLCEQACLTVNTSCAVKITPL